MGAHLLGCIEFVICRAAKTAGFRRPEEHTIGVSPATQSNARVSLSLKFGAFGGIGGGGTIFSDGRDGINFLSEIPDTAKGIK